MPVPRAPLPDRALPDDTRTPACPAADTTLEHAVAQAVTHWNEMTSQGQMSPQTHRAFQQLLERYVRYSQNRGVTLLAEATATSQRTSSTPRAAPVTAGSAIAPTPPSTNAAPCCAPSTAPCTTSASARLTPPAASASPNAPAPESAPWRRTRPSLCARPRSTLLGPAGTQPQPPWRCPADTQGDWSHPRPRPRRTGCRCLDARLHAN